MAVPLKMNIDRASFNLDGRLSRTVASFCANHAGMMSNARTCSRSTIGAQTAPAVKNSSIAPAIPVCDAMSLADSIKIICMLASRCVAWKTESWFKTPDYFR